MILITGGNGYIGSHIAINMQKVVIVDNNVGNWKKLSDTQANLNFDICNLDDLEKVFKKFHITAVIHLAALKEVGESVTNPIKYLHNNINSTTNILLCMKKYGVRKIVFSSSCSVYGDCEGCNEDTPYSPQSPYALSKQICEQLIIASGLDFSILRYFNPMGEEHGLRDFSADSLQNKLKQDPFFIYGMDYDTPDGSPMRDFIDIKELADIHIKALKWSNEIVNIGTGEPKSVLEVAKQHNVTYLVAERRPGDIAKVWADTTKYKALCSQSA